MTISLHFYNWSCNHSWYLSLLSFNLFCIPFAFSKHLCCGSLPAGMTQTFILEGSRSLVVLPGLACNFLWILITGPGNAKRSPVF